MPSCILIHPAVWPQYTNVTDRQDRTGQRSDSIAQTIFGISLCTTVVHNTAQNSYDNLPSCPPDNAHSSDAVYYMLHCHQEAEPQSQVTNFTNFGHAVFEIR